MASINCFLKCIVERFLTKPMCWIRYVKCELNDAQRASIASRNKFGKLVYNSHDKEWKYEKRWFCRTRTTIRTKYTREWVLFWTTRKPKTRSRKWGAIRNSLNPQILKTRVSKILKSVKLNQPLFRNFEFWGFQIPRFEALGSRNSKRGIQKNTRSWVQKGRGFSGNPCFEDLLFCMFRLLRYQCSRKLRRGRKLWRIFDPESATSPYESDKTARRSIITS